VIGGGGPEAEVVLDSTEELATVSLGDRRLNARAKVIVGALQMNPGRTFPQVFPENGGYLEAFYRFTNNEAVEPEDLLSPHAEATWRRAASADLRLVIHDTTEVSFPGETGRDGLVFNGIRSTLQLHVSLLADLVPEPRVYGVVGMAAYLVANQKWQRVDREDELHALASGSDRWKDAARAAQQSSLPGSRLVHVMDREADDFPLWASILGSGDDFVVRCAQNRRVEPEGLLDAQLQNEPYLFKREVTLSRRSVRRPPAERKRHPPRESRAAVLSVRAGPATIRKPRNVWKTTLPPNLALTVVEVVEVEPPAGEEPVHWRLVTTLPAATPEEAARVVDIYRKRWLIEEFFKALKSGCLLEGRQAESRHALYNTIALLVPQAVRLLQLRATSRHAPSAPSKILDEVELIALRHLVPHAKLTAVPTNREVLMAVAQLGGHLRSNGEPGWQILHRGMVHLEQFASGWRSALQALDGRKRLVVPGENDM
jgi:hypothetical protein